MAGVRPARLERGDIARHRHARAYATIVLAGGYEEAGDAGRHRVAPGNVLVHAAFSAHRDRVDRDGTEVLDLVLPPLTALPARGRIVDPDAIVRLAECDARVAARLLGERIVADAAREVELADTLAAALGGPVPVAIGAWSARHGRARETLSRQFRRLYGIDAAAYRAEARARRAWRMIAASGAPLAEIAQATGHADQAHMTRAVTALTGHSPGRWRRVTSLQDGGRPPA